MRTLGTGAIHADTHTHTHTHTLSHSCAVVLADCPRLLALITSTLATLLLQVTMATTPCHIPVLSSLIPVYLLYVSFIHLSSLHFLISSFLLSPPPLVPYSQDVKRSATVAVSGELQPAGFTVQYSRPNPSQNAAVGQSQRTHTVFL